MAHGIAVFKATPETRRQALAMADRIARLPGLVAYQACREYETGFWNAYAIERDNIGANRRTKVTTSLIDFASDVDALVEFLASRDGVEVALTAR